MVNILGLWHKRWIYMSKNHLTIFIFLMTNLQHTDFQNKKGTEFFKVYGITIVVAFLCLNIWTNRLAGENATFFDQNEVVPMVPVQPTAPIADAEDVLPVSLLKKIFIHLSF